MKLRMQAASGEETYSEVISLCDAVKHWVIILTYKANYNNIPKHFSDYHTKPNT